MVFRMQTQKCDIYIRLYAFPLFTPIFRDLQADTKNHNSHNSIISEEPKTLHLISNSSPSPPRPLLSGLIFREENEIFTRSTENANRIHMQVACSVHSPFSKRMMFQPHTRQIARFE
jgi:hypothetical protein